jgi:SulP family sulfate permease
MSSYRKSDLKGDIAAGVTVGVLLIPQGMAYAMIAGLPPIYGLYASLIPPVLYTMFGTSRQLSVAPVAMISLLIVSGIGSMAEQGSPEYIRLAIVLAALVGTLQLLFGIFRLGFLVNFLSQPVIGGYTSAAAIIIALAQLKHLLGVNMPSSNLIHEILSNTLQHIGDTHVATLLIGLGGMAGIIALRRINRQIPGALIIMALAIGLVYLFRLDLAGVKIIGEVPEGLPSFSMPALQLDDVSNLFSLALLISLVGFMESISIGKAIQARRKNYVVRANQELIGLGAANIAGSFFNAFPVSGGFSRSAVNEQAGASTSLSGIVSALIIGLVLVFLTSLFFYLPKTMLAAIIIVAVAGLIDVRLGLRLWRTSKRDFWMMNITFYATLIFGVQIGITTGIILSIILVIYYSAYPHTARLGNLPDTDYYRNLDRFPEAVDRKDALVFRFDAQLYFANIQFFKDRLQQLCLEKGDDLRVVVLNAQAIYNLDSSAVNGLEEIIEDLNKKGVSFYITEVIGPVRDVLKRTGLLQKIGQDHIHMRVHDALKHYDERVHTGHAYAVQTNVK